MSMKKPTAAERLGRGSPVTQPSATSQATGPVRVKPYRLSIDLSPADYDKLRDWAHDARMSHMDVVRALVRLLDDPYVNQQVRNHVFT